MANKMLGKVVAGAALGGASLLVFTPGIAFADGHHHDEEGKVYAKPHVVKAGDEVKLLEICEEPQEHAYVWSKVTGKVKLKPAHDREERGGDRGDRDHGKDDWKGRDDHKDKGRDDKGHDGKDKPKPQPTGTATTKPGTPPAQPPANGQGGGADAAGAEESRDYNGYEHGQDAEGRDKGHDYDREGGEGRDWNGHEEYDRGGRDDKGHEYDREGGESRDSKGHGEYGSDKGGESRDWKGHEEYGSDEESEGYGKDKDRWEHKRDYVYYGEATVSADAEPGRYKLKGSCGEGELVVLPNGGVDGGDGGVGAGTDRGLAAGGASLIGAAALGGIVLMRRRRTDESFV
ncbi:hypothetical protein [Micromonospora sp. NPDC049497]|uniref:hypothetical protein n=1 Tax=Micromonospora sp. NPDC049497 TaxID=3364273 RepID=UPI0037975004